MILDYDAYEDAAEEFHPHIKFFATFSPKVTYVIIIYTTLFTYSSSLTNWTGLSGEI